jgi:hypothetical protein
VCWESLADLLSEALGNGTGVLISEKSPGFRVKLATE